MHAVVNDHGKHKENDARDDLGPPPFGLFRVRSTNGASRQINEQEESKPNGEDRGHRQAGNRHGTARARFGDRSNLVRTALDGDVFSPKGGRDVALYFIIACLARRSSCYLDFARRIAASTLAGLNGTDRKRTPVASKTAFAIAEGTTEVVGSPAPHGTSFGRSIKSITT